MFDNADKDWPIDINITVLWTKRTCTIYKHKLGEPTNWNFVYIRVSACLCVHACVFTCEFACMYVYAWFIFACISQYIPLRISISIPKCFIHTCIQPHSPIRQTSQNAHPRTNNPLSDSQRQRFAMQICHERGGPCSGRILIPGNFETVSLAVEVAAVFPSCLCLRLLSRRN